MALIQIFNILIFSLLLSLLLSAISTLGQYHPLNSLTPLELSQVQTIVKSSYSKPGQNITFQYVGLDEPEKPLVLSWFSGNNTQNQPRQAFVIIRTEKESHSIVVDLAQSLIISDRVYRGYGYPMLAFKGDYKKRRSLWGALEEIDSEDIPWCIVGDFNCITMDTEKQGGKPFSEVAKKEFNEFIHGNGLRTLPNKGSLFSWGVNRKGNQILEKLDRALVNSTWLTSHSNVILTHLERTCSDHAPLLFQVVEEDFKGPKPFRFQRMWTLHSGFLTIVKDSWNQDCSLKGMSAFAYKLKRLKKPLKDWNWAIFGDIFRQLNVLRSKIMVLEEDNIESEDLERLREEYMQLLLAEEIYYKQKARVKWLKEGDRNTIFFHQSMLAKYKKANITHILEANGTVLQDSDAIGEGAVKFFKEALTAGVVGDFSSLTSLIPRLITKEDNDFLLAIPTMQEIKDAVFSMPIDSAPGPDGYTAGFFVSCWDIISQDLLEATKEFFTDKCLTPSYSASTLVLVPKVHNPHTFADFRPICLCQVVYKIFSKVIANRLAALMPKLVLPNQGAFIKGRLISESIALAQEMTNSLADGSRGGNVILKVDMAKAFDRVDWKYLSAVLLAFGFEAIWIKLILACVCNNKFSISIKGSQFGYFNSSRGLRQGDPISSLLFILSEEPLSRGLVNLVHSGQIIPYKVPQPCPILTHLLYADDCLIFANAEKRNLLKLMHFLNLYAEVSGQAINVHKSSYLVHSKISVSRKQIIQQVTGMAEGSFPFIYLGAPISYKRLKVADFDFLLNKISKKVAGWKGKFLSMGGKYTLIQSVLSSLPIHILSVTKPPLTVLTQIEKMFAHFFWGEEKGKKKKIWLRWERISKPKEEGGLGIKKLIETMEALHAKLIWIINTQDSLFAQFMRAKYCDGSLPHQRRISKRSQFWKALLEVWDKVSDHIDTKEGVLIWKPDLRGCFSTKSAWKVLRLSAEKWAISTFIWKSYIPIKMSILFWKVWNNGIPTDDRIQKCGIAITSKCVCCVQGSFESRDHLMGQSDIATEAWLKYAGIFGIPIKKEMNWKQKCEVWWRHSRKSNQAHLLARVVPILILWECWMYRNEVRHVVGVRKLGSIIPKVKKWLSEINELITPMQPLSEFDKLSLVMLNIPTSQILIKKPVLVTWQAPKGDVLKLNIDGSSRNNPGEAGCGGVLRDSKNSIIFAFSEYLGLGSNNLAELSALKTALLLCYQLGTFNILVETDSMLLVNWLKGQKPPWELWSLWSQVKQFLNIFNIQAQHIYRQGNQVADSLAKQGSQGVTQTYFIKEELPRETYQCWMLDSLGLGAWRH